VWQLNHSQWRVIWIIGVLLVLAWPPDQERSLAIKGVNWLADPMGALPAPPADPFAPDFDEHAGPGSGYQTARAESEEFERLYADSTVARLRLRLKDASNFFSPSTDRQVLMGLVVLGVLGIWRLGARRTS